MVHFPQAVLIINLKSILESEWLYKEPQYADSIFISGVRAQRSEQPICDGRRLSRIGARQNLPSPPFTLFDWLTRDLPGSVDTFGIDLLVHLIRTLGLGSTGDVAKIAERAFAILLIAAPGAFLGAMLSRAERM